jgi:hypothetical protein
MSTRDALIQELMKQPEPVLQEMHRYLDSVIEQRTQNDNGTGTKATWPEGYFHRTAGAFANELFERPPQLPFEKREEW